MSESSSAIQVVVIVALIGTIPPLIALIVSSLLYVLDRRSQLRQQRFENYHSLMSDLVEGRKGQQVPRLDSQIAVVYELRNYREYREVSIRILEGIKSVWSDNPKMARLIVEINYTLEKLRKRHLCEK
jgi:hypothetical protein